MNTEQRKTHAQRVARGRAALRAQGLRPRQFWLPDVHSAPFKAEARRAALAVAASADHAEVMAFVDAVQYWPED